MKNFIKKLIIKYYINIKKYNYFTITQNGVVCSYCLYK